MGSVSVVSCMLSFHPDFNGLIGTHRYCPGMNSVSCFFSCAVGITVCCCPCTITSANYLTTVAMSELRGGSMHIDQDTCGRASCAYCCGCPCCVWAYAPFERRRLRRADPNFDQGGCFCDCLKGFSPAYLISSCGHLRQHIDICTVYACAFGPIFCLLSSSFLLAHCTFVYAYVYH